VVLNSGTENLAHKNKENKITSGLKFEQNPRHVATACEKCRPKELCSQ
jgi:hypothetical protein